MQQYNVIAEQEHTNVTSHYEALPREERGYQSEAALEDAIADYNGMYCTKYSTDSKKFQNYYKNLSLRISNIESTKNWYYIYDQNGKKIKTISTSQGELMSIAPHSLSSNRVRLSILPMMQTANSCKLLALLALMKF